MRYSTKNESQNESMFLAYCVLTFSYIRTIFCSRWLGSWLKWCPTSIAMLRQAEKKILSCKNYLIFLLGYRVFLYISENMYSITHFVDIQTMFLTDSVTSSRKCVPC